MLTKGFDISSVCTATASHAYFNFSFDHGMQPKIKLLHSTPGSFFIGIQRQFQKNFEIQRDSIKAVQIAGIPAL